MSSPSESDHYDWSKHQSPVQLPPVVIKQPTPSAPAPPADHLQVQVIQSQPQSGQAGMTQVQSTPFSNPGTLPAPISQPFATHVPRGLECLVGLNGVAIRQETELLEVLLGCETKNRYHLYDWGGRQILYAKEDTDCCTRNCCGASRPFGMVISDGRPEEVIHLTRPLRCGCSCCPCTCCRQSIEVESPPGNLIGTVEQEQSLCKPYYRVKNAAGEVVLRIKGPFCTVACGGDVIFKILSPDQSVEVGEIRKQWSGILIEALTDADRFGLTFPLDLDVQIKAVLIGACMLIDFMFFEYKNQGLLDRSNQSCLDF